MSYRPEDLLPDDQDFFEKSGNSVRKGTMAAALANAEIIESPQSSPAEKQAAFNALKKLVPALRVLGLTRFVTWKNPRIQALFDENTS